MARTMTTKKTPNARVEVEWRELPPKIGRKPDDRPEAVEAGIRVRRMLEASRRARGIPRQGIVFPGEEPDRVQRKRKKK